MSTDPRRRALMKGKKKRKQRKPEPVVSSVKVVAAPEKAEINNESVKKAPPRQRTIRRRKEEAPVEVVEAAPTNVEVPTEVSSDVAPVTIETSAETASNVEQPANDESGTSVGQEATDVESTSSASPLEEAKEAQATPDSNDVQKNVVDAEIPETKAPKPVERDPRLLGLGKAVIAPPPETVPTTTGNKKSNVREFVFQDKAKEDERRKTKTKKTRGKKRRRGNNSDISVQHFDMRNDDGGSHRRRRRKSGPKVSSPQSKAIKRRIEMSEMITVANLAHAMSTKGTEVIKKLISMGVMATLNQELDFDTASLIASEFEYEIIDSSFQENAILIQNEDLAEEGGESRPPVITIMGHVDHGKTTLLDTIRKANVADSEAGGITQHTSAYQVEHQGQTLTFIDTPGHEAFTAMRARGAQVTDIVVLVVAADDGMMPQTIEALSHSRAAGVQIMVAINKVDKPNANVEKVRTELLQHELVPEEYGGDTIVAEISALKGIGISDLLDNLLLMSEMGEYKANPEINASGAVVEARLEKGRGAIATVLIKQGTLKVGDSLVLGTVSGRIRGMQDHKGNRLKLATPSMPVEITGLTDVPLAGDDFVVVRNDKDARSLVQHRQDEAKKVASENKRPVTLEDLLAQQKAGELLTLNLILKSDVNGTLEAMKLSLEKISVEGTQIKILHSGVGAISESDVMLAQTYSGILLGFNIRPDPKARRLINVHGIDVRMYSVIYQALEEIEAALKGMLRPTLKEEWKGQCEVRETFSVPRIGTVAGCFVLDGLLNRNHTIRLLRDGSELWEGRMTSLRRFKDDVREVEKGYECGIKLDGFNDIKVGDIIETFIMAEESAV